jgi:hypothetical protein
MKWRKAFDRAAEHAGVQVLVAFALLLPLAATAGQFWTTGFFRQSAGVAILFWPGVEWHWTIQVNATLVVAFFAITYMTGISLLFRRRALGKVGLAGTGALVAAKAIGAGVNYFTGWRELEQLGSMDLAGKANRAVLALWHNPIWEEIVFRGIPLICLWLVVKKWPRARRGATWCYFLIPSLIFAAYHVPGHGYSRVADTFFLSLIFAWLALRYGFSSVMVLHYVYDAVSVLSLGKLANIPTSEVQWLADNFTILNSSFSLSMLAAILLAAVLLLRYHWMRAGAFAAQER